ncbi:hypothetical protein MNBD_ALPHA12-276 [hydrothermal vent metagenome]|uniref:Chaperone required for the assembly of the mitochondrial F1-ATPase n=1 Tax=hydrothermal vent metagenome TaxID=652676 RepID=A0A3B0TT09_9ZZZZ
MREFLDDVHKHTDAGYGRAQALDKKQLAKRFYKKVSIGERDGLFSIELDGRGTKTPGKVPVLVPSRKLAQLIADEWAAQETHIEAHAMPMVRLVNSAIEGGAGVVEALRAEIIKYAGNDLLLFRAESPRELVKMQEQHWDVVLTGLARQFGIKFHPVIGIVHHDQPQNTIAELAKSLEEADHFALAALVSITGLTGSGLLAIALRGGLINGPDSWAAAHVDEDYNAKMWGADTQALARRQQRRYEFDAAITLLKLVES